MWRFGTEMTEMEKTQTEREVCLGDRKESMQLYQLSRRPHQHHVVQRVQRSDGESDESNKGSGQRREEKEDRSRESD